MITESVFRSRGSFERQTDRTERQTDHMMRITLALLLPVLLLQLGQTEAAVEDSPHTRTPPSQPNPKHSLKLAPLTLTPRPEAPHPSLISQECRSKNYTRSSCAKIFCPPWQRCINEECVCKLPYQCPRTGPGACGLDGRSYLTMCHAQALACRRKKPVFSHYSQHGACAGNAFTVQLQELEGQQVIQVSTVQKTALICGSDGWNMAAANVVCRHTTKDARGALALGTSEFKAVASAHTCPGGECECVSVRCSGAEQSLAECVLYKPHSIRDNMSVATVTCYTDQQGREECPEFRCVTEKCVSWKHVCDGVDDCGDNSDEMCCTGCQEDAFHCPSGVCLPRSAVGDQIRDCLGGEDEIQPKPDSPEEQLLKGCQKDAFHCPSGVCLPRSAVGDQIRDCLGGEDEIQPKPDSPEEQLLKEIWSNPIDDIKNARNHTEILQCGIPNMDYVHKTEEETRYKRTKRVVGGDEALPTQIQWQVAVQDETKIYCGGVYLGGCWVLTAAHCVRPKPLAFRIKFSLWMKWSRISTTDSVPVKNIIMHHNYNPRTYQNDIALIQLQELANEKECLQPNPAVRPVCLPWSRLQFPPNSTCTISGWGRNREGDSVTVLRWANVSLIPNCRNFYKERFYDGMMCAGDLEGKVDSCQGDSGGPLVCKDASGVSYVWGIVSWGERCGEAGYPGVYTEVAHYFEWIRQHTGWPAVTKYNQ